MQHTSTHVEVKKNASFYTLFMYTDCCRAVNSRIQINIYYIVYI